MKFFKAFLLTLLALVLIDAKAFAQYGPGAPTYQSWTSVGRINTNPTIATTNTVVQLPPAASGTSGGRGLTARICNLNAAAAGDFYLVFGTANTVTATVGTGTWLKAGTCGNFNLQPYAGTSYSYFAGICSGTCSSSTAYVETGFGAMSPGQ